VLVLEGDDSALSRLFDRLPLKQAHDDREVEKSTPKEEIRTVEAVVQPKSRLIGSSAARARLQDRYGVKLLAVGCSSQRITERLREITLRTGDALLLQSGEQGLPHFLTETNLLPLAERSVKPGNARQRYGPILILAAALVMVAFNLISIAIAFFWPLAGH
jgi:di/tricarboxylate transporter